jgi:LysW-gamma-L-lysine/LysW-L-ornithine aminotransferase
MSEVDPTRIEDAHLAQVYSKRPVMLTHGKGCLLYDSKGREFVDCAGGYGTCIVGHSHPRVVEAIQHQAAQLTSCHGSIYSDARARFVEKLVSIAPSGLDRVFLANSGAEAVEAAIKVARKSTGRREIIAVKGGFHGKTHGALSATWDAKYRKNFEPLVPGFSHIPFNDVEAPKTSVTSQTAAVLVEPIQGEGGVRVPSSAWLSALRDLTRDAGSLLILDEIQTGFGRTGRMYASQHFGVEPDILCLGKGIASGLPVGVTLASEKVMASLARGEHTSTFGGNPIVSASGAATIDALLEDHLIENAATVGNYFKDRLAKLQANYSIIRETRGLGLMIAIENRFDVYNILQRELEAGVIMLDAGRNVLRLLPPLCMGQQQVDRVVTTLDSVMGMEQVGRVPSQAIA